MASMNLLRIGGQAMRCPMCCVGELQKRWVGGLMHLGKQWLCTDVGRGWNTNYPKREVTQFGYCGISFGNNEYEEIKEALTEVEGVIAWQN